MRKLVWLAIAMPVLLASVSCRPTVDLRTGLQVIDVSTGWWDAGIVDGKNKLVPSITFKVKNVSDQPLTTLQANVVFRQVVEDKEWGSQFVRITGSEGLAPGATSESKTVNSLLGYTGTETRQQMLENSQFADAKIQVFAKYGSIQWQPVGEFPVPRHLITK